MYGELEGLKHKVNVFAKTNSIMWWRQANQRNSRSSFFSSKTPAPFKEPLVVSKQMAWTNSVTFHFYSKMRMALAAFCPVPTVSFGTPRSLLTPSPDINTGKRSMFPHQKIYTTHKKIHIQKPTYILRWVLWSWRKSESFFNFYHFHSIFMSNIKEQVKSFNKSIHS